MGKLRNSNLDGLCEPRNPGGYACGGYVIEPSPYMPARVGGRCFGHGPGMTNNVAEYMAALLALETIHEAGYGGPVILRGDSQLVVRQWSGAYRCEAPLLVPLLGQLRAAAEPFESVTLEWVPRAANEEADAASRRAHFKAARTPRSRQESSHG
jgi:ribonuclease HI